MTAAAGEGPGATGAARSVACRAKVLIIDDNADLGENLKEIFEVEGYEVALARTGAEGLRLAAADRPDVALVDINLPDVGGIAVLRDVRARSPHTACVILTGNASLESAIAALDLGAYSYVVKGTSVPELLAALDRAASHVRLGREKRALEAQLDESRRLAEAIVRNAAVGIVVVAPDGCIVNLNPTAEAILGVKRNDAAARDAASLAAALEARPEAVRGQPGAADLRAVLEGRERVQSVGFELGRTGRSARVIVEVSTSAVDCEEGRRIGTVAAIVDVTEERRLRRRLLDAERLAAIGEVAARVAHEIRNPLAGISSAIQVMARDFPKPSKKADTVRDIVHEVGRLNAFVEDLLIYARPLRPNRTAVPFREVVDRALALLRESPILRGITVDVKDHLDGGRLDVDPNLFVLILENLLLNAAEAQKGAGQILVEARPEGPDCVVVAVEDRGPGIADDAIDNLFKPFHSTKHKGTGLGLSTTKKIVEAHGGTIRARNLPGGGARFEVVVRGA